jgi:predicted CopG family antitoxin
MQTIEIDFDVYKALTNKRKIEKETYNDVLRAILGLGPLSVSERTSTNQSEGDWIYKSVHFPSGTEFQANYKGNMYHAQVKDGALYLNGESYNSPSAAAISITGNPVNGWIFWECRLPGQNSWKNLKSFKELKRQ